jgi:hypothetical protein
MQIMHTSKSTLISVDSAHQQVQSLDSANYKVQIQWTKL